jgi:DNA invertase Pin-like site-specific DNA recombinase
MSIKTKIKAGLARVSTDKQQYAVGLSNQIQRLRAAGCTRIYADIASRSDENRAGVDALLAAVDDGEIESVTVTVLDRATGSPALFDRITKVLLQHGVPLHGLDEAIDIGSEGGEMVAGIGVVMAKMEVRKIRARAQRGHDAKRRNTRANAVPPFGYVNRDRKYALDTSPYLCMIDGNRELSKADLARDTIAIFRQCQSLTMTIAVIHEKYGICLKSNPRGQTEAQSFVLEDDDELSSIRGARGTNRSQFSWTHKGLRNWLFNPVLRGHTSYGTRQYLGLDDCGRRRYGGTLPQDQWEIHRDTHTEAALLTEADYESFKAIIEINGRSRPNTQKWIENQNLRYPISGLIYCGECGGKCGAQGTKKRGGEWHSYYKCRNAMHHKSCNQNRTVRNDRIEAAIVDALVKAAADIDQASQVEPAVTVTVSPELANLRNQLAGLMALGNNASIVAAIDDTRAQIRQLEFTEMSKEQKISRTREDLKDAFFSPGYWDFMLLGGDIKTLTFNQFVDRVIIRDGQVINVFLKL